ncbi:hypothetical protein [Sulfuracidifex tepidarius]|uniref:Uncharacterized protein n=1 Tax=Sulfuracidifex tepidarius TaxID=1294262 RepID=A0A510E053_9CREN|nr:hypothetical protein [Sulfuracidifex tepidarius]BBG25875.1 hypothetical protein IC007_0380 [Sulfuracidifex tepidarius]
MVKLFEKKEREMYLCEYPLQYLRDEFPLEYDKAIELRNRRNPYLSWRY